MPSSAMLATARADNDYIASLDSKGFSTNGTIQYEGKTYSHDDIAAMVETSYQKHRPEYAIVCGGKPRVNRKRTRQLEKAVKSEVYGTFKISWWTIAMGAIVLLLSGPLGLVLAVISCYFSYLLEKDLNGDPQMMTAMGCA